MFHVTGIAVMVMLTLIIVVLHRERERREIYIGMYMTGQHNTTTDSCCVDDIMVMLIVYRCHYTQWGKSEMNIVLYLTRRREHICASGMMLR